MNRQENFILWGIVCVSLYSIVFLLDGCNTPKDQRESSESVAPATFVGSSTCQSCHTQEFSDWKKSDHYLAMQHAHESTVLGNFSNTTLIADGVITRFFKKENKFYINTQGDDGKNHDYEVLYAFGFFPLQQYLIAA